MLWKSCPKESGIDSQPKRPRNQSSQVSYASIILVAPERSTLARFSLPIAQRLSSGLPVIRAEQNHPDPRRGDLHDYCHCAWRPNLWECSSSAGR
jgi:hypothetical protein